jgi:lysophospholipase L1-like esterase
MKNQLYKITALLLFLSAAPAFACPTIHNLQDVNCDGKFNISVLGDSIGRGSRGNLRAAGSYVKRIGRSFRFATIKNLSIPGLDTQRAIRYLSRDFARNIYAVKKSLLNNSDFVLIQLGINDFFADPTPQDTVDRLKEIIRLISTYMETHGGVPVFAVAFITPVKPISMNRAQQRIFAGDLNADLKDAQSAAFPAYVRFDKVPVSDIFPDGIHPGTAGHDLMTKILTAYIKKTLAEVPPTPTETPTSTPTATAVPTDTATPTPTVTPTPP